MGRECAWTAATQQQSGPTRWGAGEGITTQAYAGLQQNVNKRKSGGDAAEGAGEGGMRGWDDSQQWRGARSSTHRGRRQVEIRC
jgi:hypothetical protein